MIRIIHLGVVLYLVQMMPMLKCSQRLAFLSFEQSFISFVNTNNNNSFNPYFILYASAPLYYIQKLYMIEVRVSYYYGPIINIYILCDLLPQCLFYTLY